MKKVFRVYLPAFTLAFTIIVLFAAIHNLINGYTKDGFLYFILEVVGYLAIAVVIDCLVGKINFRKYAVHCLTEIIVLYPVTIGIAVWGNWFPVNPLNMVGCSCIYAGIMILLHYYFYLVSRKQAEEINELLQTDRRE